ncbi:MAG TPA: diaminopimelate decarboxylase [Caulobacteraceae bacterium]|jgi:diaminopimelate decarboxylase|nr:diaminopimelate decarboxylase [Caulobacteraceae bacterium]
MNHFEPRDGGLCCEDVGLQAIAASVGTPVYVYSSATLERHYRVFAEGLAAHEATRGALIAYAVKANSALAVLATLARLGSGADTVSEGEIRRALAAGVPADRIVFSGVGKTASEIAFALERRVAQINVESEPELDLVSRTAQSLGAVASIGLRINPDVGAGGHAKITTGAAASKFGVARGQARRLYAGAAADPHLAPRGLACHIGSQISDMSPLEAAWTALREETLALRAGGLCVERLDFGGGLGVPYFDQPDPPSPAAFATAAARIAQGLEVSLIFEPGRAIAANAGVLLAKVLHVHERPDGRRFLVVDAAMNDLIRPAMYDAWHDIRPVCPREGEPRLYDVVGPVCETGDTFARGRLLPPLQGGDLVAFMTAGAYGSVMASEYNSRPLAPEVLVHGDEWALTRPRPTYEAMLARECLPDWL